MVPEAVRLRPPEAMVSQVKSRGWSLCLAVALLDEVVHQFAGAVVHLNVKRFHLAGEVVERHNGWDGNEKTECSRHQGLGNTTGHCADTRGLLGCNLLEGVQNSDHCSEQADKGCRRTDRRQTTKPTLQLGMNNRLRALKCALRAFDLLFCNVA